jgi:ABC-type molybdate transport system substrate-binding protein
MRRQQIDVRGLPFESEGHSSFPLRDLDQRSWKAYFRPIIAAGLVYGMLLGGNTVANAQTGTQSPVLHVMTSGGFTGALQTLVPRFEKARHVHIEIDYGPSMGSTANAIPTRLDRGDPADVVVLVREALDNLAAKGQVGTDGITDLAKSRIAMAVKTGSPVPDISTMAAFRKTLVAAKSVAYSDSASGVYLQNVLFPKMGLADQMKAKAHMIPATPVGQIVAHGDDEIGFQQNSELKPVPGIKIVGFIPEEAQKVTIYSAAAVLTSKQLQGAKEFITYLSSDEARKAISDSGMEPFKAVEAK